MRSLAGLCCAALVSGCLSFPSAHLVASRGARVQVAAPVVCGPVGFRRVPLQSRWGEFVRVTVAAPVALRGTVLVHANGVGREPRAWSTGVDGSLVVEARFENLDPDRRFALDHSRPIDLTITGLEAPAGGSCAGAVFTVEQGALVPTIGERAWVAELERRGGPELAARREALRVEREARRQAHSAAWEERRRVEVSAEVALERTLVREAHYAAWEARREAGGSAGVAVEAVAVVETHDAAGGGATVSGAAATTAGPPLETDERLRAQAGAACSQPCDAQLRAQAGAEWSPSSDVAWGQPSDAQFRVQTGAEAPQPSGADFRVQAGAEWSQPSDAQFRAQAGGAASPPDVAARLEPVVVSSESQVAVGAPACSGRCGAQAAFSVALPVLFHALFNAGAVPPPPPPGPPAVHRAVPVSAR